MRESSHTPESTSPALARYSAALPGLVLSLLVGVVATWINHLVPTLSGMLVAILAGIIWCNIRRPGPRLQPGIAIAGKQVLRLGIVLLGLQLAFSDIAAIGGGAFLLAVLCVAGTFLFTVLVGRALRLAVPLVLLIASGFSICGAAAVAGAMAVSDADEDDTATALALVVLFGTLMIPLMPLLVHALGFDETASGMLIGLSTHEVAQVVAAGGIIGAQTLSVAVTVKLSRVLMLAPVMIGLSGWRRWLVRQEQRQNRRQARAAAASLPGGNTSLPGGSNNGQAGARTEQSAEASENANTLGAADAGTRAALPPLIPAFVLGFIICVAVRSTGLIPMAVLDVIKPVQTVLLSAAMFALGMGVHFRSIIKVGLRPVVLAALATAFIIGLATLGVNLLT
ncbi:YeiH family protein [Actinobaculum suis]|uniref:YeiH family protein n=1 Tax=Actinobaculum suis TaxID=1657 RepID=UPI0008087126|nr:putative sulfate exporter family transporter [Actinobaculum suis]OCA94348.1 hypothetical protein ACU21_07335 [Actinobaculum suis]OCA95177.1 hypothetical protein ACU20_05320 [Actinobaculum suis]